MTDEVTKPVEMTRRRMLMRLGLAASAIYAAPVMLQLSDAKASGFSGKSVSFSRGESHGKRTVGAKEHVKQTKAARHRHSQDSRRRRRHIKSFSS